jgi:hypothetical protein
MNKHPRDHDELQQQPEKGEATAAFNAALSASSSSTGSSRPIGSSGEEQALLQARTGTGSLSHEDDANGRGDRHGVGLDCASPPLSPMSKRLRTTISWEDLDAMHELRPLAETPRQLPQQQYKQQQQQQRFQQASTRSNDVMDRSDYEEKEPSRSMSNLSSASSMESLQGSPSSFAVPPAPPSTPVSDYNAPHALLSERLYGQSSSSISTASVVVGGGSRTNAMYPDVATPLPRMPDLTTPHSTSSSPSNAQRMSAAAAQAAVTAASVAQGTMSEQATFRRRGGVPAPAAEGTKQDPQYAEKSASSPAAAAATTKAVVMTGKEEFSDWNVGDRYELLRILGRGSYGEVAQAKDLRKGGIFVAIKRITSAFGQEVDAVRLYREMHVLRRLNGHECIIQLLNIVPPPKDDLDHFNDLYLVFECTFRSCAVLCRDTHLFQN